MLSYDAGFSPADEQSLFPFRGIWDALIKSTSECKGNKKD